MFDKKIAFTGTKQDAHNLILSLQAGAASEKDQGRYSFSIKDRILNVRSPIQLDGFEKIVCPPNGSKISWSVETIPLNHNSYLETDSNGNKRKKSYNRVLERKDWLSWFQRKMGDAILFETIEYKKNNFERKYKGFSFSWVFSGEGEVIDSDKFKTLVSYGIGPLKSYGLGMIVFKRT